MKNEELNGFIKVFADMITHEELKAHVESYLPYETEEDIKTFIESGGAFSVFVKHSPWYRREIHKRIVDIMNNLCSYVIRENRIPDTVHQSLSDGSEEYQDSSIVERVWAVSATWK